MRRSLSTNLSRKQSRMPPSKRLREEPTSVAAATAAVGAEDVGGAVRALRHSRDLRHRFRSILVKLRVKPLKSDSTALLLWNLQRRHLRGRTSQSSVSQ